MMFTYGQQPHKQHGPHLCFTKENFLFPECLVMNMLEIKREPYQIMSMTHAFKLAVNILERNGLAIITNYVLLKVKHNTMLDYKLQPVYRS